MQQNAVFLDRDGTINKDPGYLGNPDLVELLPGVSEGIFKLRNVLNFKIVVISNQSGVSRGLITHSDVISVNNKINSILSENNTQIDAFYYCPYHPDFDNAKLSECRKPSPKMIQKAAAELNLSLEKSYMIGDKGIDVLCGLNAGVKSVLLKNVSFEDEINGLKNEGKTPNFVADNFLQAVQFIADDISRR